MKNLKSLASLALGLSVPIVTLLSGFSTMAQTALIPNLSPGGWGQVWNASGTLLAIGATGLAGITNNDIENSNSYVVVSANTAAPVAAIGGGYLLPSTAGYAATPVVKYISVTNDQAWSLSGAITFYASTNAQTVLTTNGLTGNFSGGQTNVTLSAGNSNLYSFNHQVLLVRHVATDTYEPNMLWATGTNALVVTNSAVTNVSTYVQITLAFPCLQTIQTNDMIYQCTSNGILPAPTALTTYGVDSGGGVYVGQPGMPLLMIEKILAQGKILNVSGEYR